MTNSNLLRAGIEILLFHVTRNFKANRCKENKETTAKIN